MLDSIWCFDLYRLAFRKCLSLLEEKCINDGIQRDGITRITKFPKQCLDRATQDNAEGDNNELWKCAWVKCGEFRNGRTSLTKIACDCKLSKIDHLGCEKLENWNNNIVWYNT